MRLGVLGPLEVSGDEGTAVPIGGRRQQMLLAVLAAAAPNTVGTDTLVEALWGTDLPVNPPSALHSQVARLRRTLATADAGDLVVTRPGGYRLDPTIGDLDAEGFAELVRQAQEATDPAQAAALAGEALALWRGRPFGDLLEVPVLQAEAARLQEMRAGIVELRGGALVDAGCPQEAVAELEAFVVDEPLREHARATLMRALVATGRHADALAHYERHRAVLAEELGLEPSVALQRLHLAVLRHELPDHEPPTTADGGRREREPAPLDALTVHYATRRDGAPIAYACVGDGPTVVAVPAWVGSLDLIAAGRDPRSSVLEHLAHHVELVLYDRLGTGLSRAPVTDHSADAAADELISLLEHLGRPAALLAMSQAGPTALLAAQRRPDLVAQLILFGTFADGPATFTNRELVDAVLRLGRAHWPLAARMLAGLYRPAASAAVTDHLARVLLDSAEPDVALGYLAATYETDVSAALAGIGQPALVLHYQGDRVIPFRGGRQMAAGLPRATLVPLEGAYHLPDAADLTRLVDLITDALR